MEPSLNGKSVVGSVLVLSFGRRGGAFIAHVEATSANRESAKFDKVSQRLWEKLPLGAWVAKTWCVVK